MAAKTAYNHALFQEIVRELKDSDLRLHGKADEILDQVKRTNGRVSSLERWREYATGAIAVLTMLVVPLILYIAQQIIHA